MRRNHITIACVIMTFLFIGIELTFSQEARRTQRVTRQSQPDVLHMTPEQEAEVLKYLKEVRPEQYEELERLKERRPEQYRRLISRAFREIRYMEELKEKDPDRFKVLSQEKQLERETQKLARQYRNSNDDEEKEQLLEELTKLLEKSFDLRQMNREFEIERLEKRLAEAKTANTKRLENKEEIVRLRLSQMLGKRKEFEW